MAIKVKHDGNATSRIYAAAAGGKGKRQAEDAKVLLAAQQRGSSGGGGGTSGGSRGGGSSAPLLSAGKSQAALGSVGQIMSPPQMSFNQRTRLQTQQDDAAMERLSTDHKWRTSENELDRLNKIELQENEHTFRSEESALDREHKTNLQQFELGWRTGENQKDRDHKTGLQQNELDWRAKQEQDRREYEESQKITTLRRDEMNKKGFSIDQITEIEGIDADIAAIQGNAKFTPEEKAQAIAELNEKKGLIKPLYPPQATAQQDFENSIVTDPTTGLRYRKTSRGEFELLETPPTNQNDAAAKAQARQAQKAWDKYQKFVDEKLKEKYAKSQDPYAKDEDKIFDREKIMKEAEEDYEAIYGAIPSDPNETPTPSPTPTPTPTPAPNPATADELKNKYRD